METKLNVVRTRNNDDAVSNLVFVHQSQWQDLGTLPILQVWNSPEKKLLFAVKTRHQGLVPGEISLNSSMREALEVKEGQQVQVEVLPEKENKLIPVLPQVKFQVGAPTLKQRISKEWLEEVVVKYFDGSILNHHQICAVTIHSKAIYLHVQLPPFIKAGWFRLDAKPEVKFEGFVESTSLLKSESWDLSGMGVGGLQQQLEVIFRRVLLTRLLRKDVFEEMGLRHVKGVILYGPSGVGKTLVVSALSKMIRCEPPTIINGPEVLSKWVGQSEANMRAIFDTAESHPDKLYLVIFDEIDSLLRKRGSSGSESGMRDGIVNTLLAKMDGIQSPQNLILFGTTNRLDLIDSAVLRPGRFEVHIEIKLPDLEARREILEIHTSKIKKSLAPDVDLQQIAKQTDNRTGAELESIIGSAVSLSLREEVTLDNLQAIRKLERFTVTNNHIQQAIESMPPVFGKSPQLVALSTPAGPLVSSSVQHEKCYDMVQTFLRPEDQTEKLLLGIEGQRKTGKTFLAASLARLCGDSSGARYISSFDLALSSDVNKCQLLADAFHSLRETKRSILVLDDVDIMVAPTQQPVFIHTISAIQSIMATPWKHGKLIIVISFTCRAATQQAGFLDFLDHHVVLRPPKQT